MRTTTTTTTKGLRPAVGSGALAFTLSSPSRRAAGPGMRHPARGVPRAQPRDVRSAGRETWNLTGEALGGPGLRGRVLPPDKFIKFRDFIMNVGSGGSGLSA